MLKQAGLIAIALLAVAPLVHADADDETPDQRSYEGRMDREIRTWIHEGNHEATDDERHAIDDHWKRAARLWRIRKLANEAHDMASVKRADQLLARADHVLEMELGRYRGHAPVMTVAPPVFETTEAPPPPQPESHGAPPTPGEQWVPGFWGWNGHRHIWNPGHWSAPPQPGMTWEAPKWENRSGRWAFEEGRWVVTAPAPNVVYEPPAQPEVTVETAPPPPIVEVRPPPPQPRAVWIPGYWHWNGHRHTWVGGRWSAPKQNMRWEPDHWVRIGNRWKLERGHWAR